MDQENVIKPCRCMFNVNFSSLSEQNATYSEYMKPDGRKVPAKEETETRLNKRCNHCCGEIDGQGLGSEQILPSFLTINI